MAGVEVVIPLRWDSSRELEHGRAVADMAAYLARLCAWAEVTVVDGSSARRRAEHSAAWRPFARVIPPDERRAGCNGKVVGALTGIDAARHELVVLADDDVRYDARTLGQVIALLADADVVRPQNVFDRWPWHARWDGSRSLVNRALAADWPGTFGLRRSFVQGMGGWDPDVLFENLELVRTAAAAGGRIVQAPGILVARVPPSAAHFRSQRVRQAYDDLAQPGRLVVEACTLPLALLTLASRPRLLGYAGAGVVLLAHCGRRRAGGRYAVPPDVPYWAPVWVAERALCVWLALAARARGGMPYHGRRVKVAAHSYRQLRRRARAQQLRPSAAGR